jgi:hypothetical protein
MTLRKVLALTALGFIPPLCACREPTPSDTPPETSTFAHRHETGTGPVRLVTELSSEAIGTLDALDYRLTLVIGPGFAADFPEIYHDEHFADFVVTRTETREETDADGTRRIIRDYALEPEFAGKLTLGPLQVYYHLENEIKEEELVTEPIEVTISAEQVAEADLALRPVRGLITVEAYQASHRRVWPWVLGGMVLVGASVTAGVWYLRRPRPVPPPPPAHEVAMNALHALVAKDLVAGGEIERFFVLLSGIVRSYIEDAFGVRAPEQTTEEFLQDVAAAPALAAHRTSLAPFLQVADEVKFAQHRPESVVIQRAFETARDFIQQTADTRPATTERAA